MRICFVAHSGRNGGAERVLLETIEILQSRGIECHVIVPEPGYFCGALQKLGVPFFVISFPHWMSRGSLSLLTRAKCVLGTILNSLVLAWRIHRLKCDLVYTNTVTVCTGAFAARLLGCPHIWHLHEFGKEDQGLSFLFGEHLSLLLVNRFSTRCICVSKILAEKYKQYIDPGKVTVIYPSLHLALNGADTVADSRSVAPPHGKRFRCVIVGTLMEGKGQEESVLAFAELKKSGVDAELLILGEGIPSYRSHLEQLVDTHGLRDNVSFLGQAMNSLPVMRCSDAVLVCSRSEAFGRVTIEAMLVGKPVIGARSGATQELITDGVNGLVYELGNPSDLAAKIKYLSENADVAISLARNAGSWTRSHFNEDRYGDEILPVLTSLCASPRTGTRPSLSQ